jgi:nicotinate phosphoribosyltransferase
MRSILEEVRWELDAHGYSGVKIFLSGGVTREDVMVYNDIVDAFGVGGAIANAQVIDFGMDIVEIEGTPKAKRGKRSGVKQVYELPDGKHCMLPARQKPPAGAKALIEPFIKNGKIIKECDMQEARRRVRQKLPALSNVEYGFKEKT